MSWLRPTILNWTQIPDGVDLSVWNPYYQYSHHSGSCSLLEIWNLTHATGRHCWKVNDSILEDSATSRELFSEKFYYKILFFVFQEFKILFLTKLVSYSMLFSSIFFSTIQRFINRISRITKGDTSRDLFQFLTPMFEINLWEKHLVRKVYDKGSEKMFQTLFTLAFPDSRGKKIIILQRTIAYKVQFQAQFLLTVSEN